MVVQCDMASEKQRKASDNATQQASIQPWGLVVPPKLNPYVLHDFPDGPLARIGGSGKERDKPRIF